MKCTKCGHEMPDNAKFCEMCGTPFDVEHTQLADDDIRDDYNNYNAYENNTPGGYAPNSDYPDRRYDDRGARDRSYYNAPGYHDPAYREPAYNDPRYNDPGYDPRGQKPRMSTQKKAVIISSVALVLVVAILAGVVFFVSRNKVSAAELDEAKQNYLPPAEAVSIDTSKDDPSNDTIKYKYDNRARVSSCTYAVNDKTYDQSYGYNDKKKIIKIDTKYRDHTIFTKEIEYGRIKQPNVFEVIDGYCIRLDETSLGIEASSSVPVVSADPEPAPKRYVEPAQPTEKPVEKQKETEKPASSSKAKESEKLEKYKELYLDFLDSTGISYDYGTLIYLNDDDTPELILWSSGSEVPYHVCYILNGSVRSYETDSSHSLEYTEKGGYFTSGKYNQTGNIYYFDGSSVSAKHTYSFSHGNDEYYIDQDKLTREEYFDEIDNRYLIKDRKHDASNDPHDKSNLQDYIRDFE